MAKRMDHGSRHFRNAPCVPPGKVAEFVTIGTTHGRMDDWTLSVRVLACAAPGAENGTEVAG